MRMKFVFRKKKRIDAGMTKYVDENVGFFSEKRL